MACRPAPADQGRELQAAGRVCTTYGKTPADLKKLSPKEAYALLLQVRDDMALAGKASIYIGGVVNTLRSFFSFNDIMVSKRLHIQKTPEDPGVSPQVSWHASLPSPNPYRCYKYFLGSTILPSMQDAATVAGFAR